MSLGAPDEFVSPWTDTAGQFFDVAARIGAHQGLWDDPVGRFDGSDLVSRSELALVVTAAVADLCPDDPFTAARSEWLDSQHPLRSFTAYAYDIPTGCAFWLNPDNRQPTASVFKVMVMAGTLLEAQQADRDPSAYEMSQMEPMITESANLPVRELWSWFGGAPWFGDQAEAFALDQTSVVGDDGQPWGRTVTSGLDQANLLRQVLLGEWGPLEGPGRAIALDLMTSVVGSQTWGVTAGVPDTWSVAQKNGFADPHTNSVGVVYGPGGEARYVVVVLTTGWPSYSDGIPVVGTIAGWVADSLVR